MPNRSVVFVDGNNWYHGLKKSGVSRFLGPVDLAKVSQKLVAEREWIGTRYYVGQVQQTGNLRLYADQRRFLSHLTNADKRISVHLGRIEHRPVPSAAARELRRYVQMKAQELDAGVAEDLLEIALRNQNVGLMKEKAVDVMLAVDMVIMAERGEYDSAYLLSADGDFTPAVEAVTGLGIPVYVASPLPSERLVRIPRFPAGHSTAKAATRSTGFRPPAGAERRG